MDPSLARRTFLVDPSPTLTLDAEVKALKAQGKKIINLGVGEPDFETPDFIREAAIKAIRDGFTRYTPSEGILSLREAVAQKFKRDNGLDYSPEDVVITCGAKHALYNVAQALFNPGDEVIVPAPYWVTYPPQIKLAGAIPVYASAKDSARHILSPEDLESKITPRTRGLILNSPSNPTGAVYSKEELSRLAEVLRARPDIWIISDDIYEKLVYDGQKFHNIAMVAPDLKERTAICHGVSKTYSMTGWRVGFLAGPRALAKTVARVQSQMTSNPCSIAQVAGLAALTGPQDRVDEMFRVFESRRGLILRLLAKIDGFATTAPEGAFYCFPNVSRVLGATVRGSVVATSDQLASLLLKECEVATIPGAGFGAPQALRFSYAASAEDIEEGLGRVSALLGAART
ncbi:MAG: pyridoxal phosphate-dependent aminotransferase [Deltaproteobacteria bacterium]|jgi:aspartate aminotransferase|nr:pyridoxal phosphate-dependent aminotransferase [Deltaproteobacteria bacterium]